MNEAISENVEELARSVEQTVINILQPLLLRLQNADPSIKVLMWEAVARKANTYAARFA